MNNLDLYNAVCQPPAEALKPIQAGRLKGKTDINPMWRIKALTEQFGPCGIGWYTADHRISYQTIGEETLVTVELNLYIRQGDGWSAPIYGVGGNKVGCLERNGLYADDEGVKKAYSDAIGIACKALGMAANVYWENDPTKYDAKAPEPHEDKQLTNKGRVIKFCDRYGINPMTEFPKWREAAINGGLAPEKLVNDLTSEELDQLLDTIYQNYIKE